jgi:hypothetical protein
LSSKNQRFVLTIGAPSQNVAIAAMGHIEKTSWILARPQFN